MAEGESARAELAAGGSRAARATGFYSESAAGGGKGDASNALWEMWS